MRLCGSGFAASPGRWSRFEWHMLGELSVQLSALSIEEVKIDRRLHSKPLNH